MVHRTARRVLGERVQFGFKSEDLFRRSDEMPGAAAHDVREVVSHLQAHELPAHELARGQAAALRTHQLPQPGISLKATRSGQRGGRWRAWVRTCHTTTSSLRA